MPKQGQSSRCDGYGRSGACLLSRRPAHGKHWYASCQRPYEWLGQQIVFHVHIRRRPTRKGVLLDFRRVSEMLVMSAPHASDWRPSFGTPC